MSIENPYGINGFWRIDPDNRQDRSSGPVTTRMMTIEEKIKYGMTVESEEGKMKLTKANVRKLAAEGMANLEIMEYFAPEYPKMKKSLILAKVALYLSDKKLGKPKKDKPALTDKEISAINSHEDHLEPEEATNIKEIAEQVGKQVARAAKESAEKIKLRQAVDEMLEMIPDNINHPAHYTAGKVEVIDYLQEKMTAEMFEGFCIGNALKYLSRYRFKGGVEDLKKAEWYLNRIIKVMETA